MRKVIIGAFLLLVAAAATAQAPAGATDITAAQIEEFFKSAPHDRNSDRFIRVLDAGGYNIGIAGVYRPKVAPPAAVVHKTKVSEVYYMLDGVGTLVTGGTLKPPLMTSHGAIGNWDDVFGAGIDGGRTRRVAKGDVVLIPGGVPHMWASVETDAVTYLIVRPDPDKQIPLK